MNCSICGEEIETHFLDKIKGTYVNGEPVCSECQKEHAMEGLRERV